MHWAQGAERAAVVPPRPKFCCYRFGGEISFLAWLSGNYSLPSSAQASCDSDRQTSLERSARLATQNWVRVVEGT